MSVASHFDAMSYGPAPEGDAEARAWLARHADGFGHFIGGAFVGAASGTSISRVSRIGLPLSSASTTAISRA